MSRTIDPGRRRFLRGMGVCLALPAFESLAPRSLLAAAPGPATTASGAPLRMAFCYVPNGVILDQWMPKGSGKSYSLNRSMQALEGLRDDFQIITGLAQQNGTSGGDGGGDHARAVASILTGTRPKKTSGADIRLGVSVDQLAAQQVGDATRFSSLELSCDGVRKSGACDSGYSVVNPRCCTSPLLLYRVHHQSCQRRDTDRHAKP